MPKKLFWPISLVVMGFVILSANLGLIPIDFWFLWPIILIVVGLGGILTVDREEWLYEPKKKARKKSKKKKK